MMHTILLPIATTCRNIPSKVLLTNCKAIEVHEKVLKAIALCERLLPGDTCIIPCMSVPYCVVTLSGWSHSIISSSRTCPNAFTMALNLSTRMNLALLDWVSCITSIYNLPTLYIIHFIHRMKMCRGHSVVNTST